jgi:hypothetical protein
MTKIVANLKNQALIKPSSTLRTKDGDMGWLIGQ